MTARPSRGLSRRGAAAGFVAAVAGGTILFVGGVGVFVSSELPDGSEAFRTWVVLHAARIFGGGAAMTLGVWVFARGMRGLRSLKPVDVEAASAQIVQIAARSHFGRVLVPQVASELSLAPEQVARLLAWMETNGRCRRERVEGWEVFTFPVAAKGASDDR